ncbi:hypothetical protein [Faecalibacterium sp. An192]|uniref:hypothetical protein n=1 Tax=Faecalibacterium sp. An192 TaxID=1965581 RepID=UPI000B38699A|nr:hypothetical protein [Faecalibacterium sp. An192]OUP26922.1 hypothetical protein B5F27_11825 [Faecalibacterium sp. An192]
MNELYGMTAEFAADALAADLEELFAGQLFRSSAGGERAIRYFVNDLPVRTGNDEDRSQDAPEPYIIVRIGEGTIPEGDAAQEVQIVLVVALYDDRPDRQGYRDLLHIIQEIAARYCKNPVIRIRPGSAGARGGPYTVKKPIQWAIWNDSKAHPYYLGAVEFQLEIPTICPEVPFT